MAAFEPLIDPKDIRTTLLAELGRQTHYLTSMSYDEYVDALTLLFVPNDQEWVVHFIDEHVGFAYLADSLELVGLYIEGVQHGFLQEYEELQHVWNEWSQALRENRATPSLAARLVTEITEAIGRRTKGRAPDLAAALV